MLQTREKADEVDGCTLTIDTVDRLPAGRLAVRLDVGGVAVVAIRSRITDAEWPELENQLHQLLGPAREQACWDCLVGQRQHTHTG